MVTEREGQFGWFHFVTLHLCGVEADGSDRTGFTAPPGSLPVAPSATQTVTLSAAVSCGCLSGDTCSNTTAKVRP